MIIHYQKNIKKKYDSPPIVIVVIVSIVLIMRAKGCDKLAILVRESLFVLIALIILMVYLPFFLLWQMITCVGNTIQHRLAISANTRGHTHSIHFPHSS